MPTSKKAKLSPLSESAPDSLVPVAPESSESGPAKKRKRLAKVFSRPLDKIIREPAQLRVKLCVREDEYAQLVDLQRRLAAQGVRVKKGALLRAGLQLLATQDDGDFLQALARLPAID